MAFYVFYVWCLAILNFRTRKGAVTSGQVKVEFFKTYQGPASERVIVVGRHYDNQFQLPVLFFAACLAEMALGGVDWLGFVLAWIFIATRLWHSYIHLGSNKILRRASAYAAGWSVIFLMWANLCYRVIVQFS